MSKFKVGDRVKSLIGDKGTVAYLAKDGDVILELDDGSSNIFANDCLIKLKPKMRLTKSINEMVDLLEPHITQNRSGTVTQEIEELTKQIINNQNDFGTQKLAIQKRRPREWWMRPIHGISYCGNDNLWSLEEKEPELSFGCTRIREILED